MHFSFNTWKQIIRVAATKACNNVVGDLDFVSSLNYLKEHNYWQQRRQLKPNNCNIDVATFAFLDTIPVGLILKFVLY